MIFSLARALSRSRRGITMLLLIATHAVPLAARPTKSRPNFVVILADDLGYGDVRAFAPDSRVATPHLDRLAAEGMSFTDAHSPSAVCTPTRYALLTGRYAWRTRLQKGVLGGYSPPLIEVGRETIASFLKKHGYHTGAVGKWHLGMAMPRRADAESAGDGKATAVDDAGERWDGDGGVDFSARILEGPTTRGFDSYFGVSASLDMAPYVYIRDDRFTAMPSLQQRAVPFPHFIRQGPRAADFIVEDVLDRLVHEAGQFLERAAGRDEPFFLYLPLTAPHKPTQPHPRFRGRSGLGEYADFIVQVDAAVGEMLARIEDLDLAGNTLLVFTSDNGSYMYRLEEGARDHTSDPSIQGYAPENHRANGPLRGTKADIWEAGHRVPFIVRWPGHVEPGSRSNATICHADLFATFAEILGATPALDKAEDSVSLASILRGDSTARGVPVVHHSVSGLFALRDGPWKLIAGNGSGGRERPVGEPFAKPYGLYRLDEDLGEKRDLTAEHPEIVERLSAVLEEIRSRGRSAER